MRLDGLTFYAGLRELCERDEPPPDFRRRLKNTRIRVSLVKIKGDALRQWQFRAPVDCIGLATTVSLP